MKNELCLDLFYPSSPFGIHGPVQCNRKAGHTGSHSYSDGERGVSWGQAISGEGSGGGEGSGEGSGGTMTIDFPSVIEYNKARARKRRERIATAVLGAIYVHTLSAKLAARHALEMADALIAEMDKVQP